jgi:hypothetical protein
MRALRAYTGTFFSILGGEAERALAKLGRRPSRGATPMSNYALAADAGHVAVRVAGGAAEWPARLNAGARLLIRP